MLGRLIPDPESVASPRDLFAAAAFSALLPAAWGPCPQPTSPWKKLLPTSQELL